MGDPLDTAVNRILSGDGSPVEDDSRAIAKAIVAFHYELREAHLPDELAADLTREYGLAMFMRADADEGGED